MTCRPTSAAQETPCATQILTTLARRAYRRPVTDADVKPLMAFYEDRRAKGGDFDSGIEMAMRRLLTSPEFLFHIETEPKAPVVKTAVAASTANAPAAYKLSDIELSSLQSIAARRMLA